MRLINSRVYYYHQRRPSLLSQSPSSPPTSPTAPPAAPSTLFSLVSAEALSSSFPHTPQHPTKNKKNVYNCHCCAAKALGFPPSISQDRLAIRAQERGGPAVQAEREFKGGREGEGKIRGPPIGQDVVCVSNSISFHIKVEAYFWTVRLNQAGSSLPYKNNSLS